MGNEASHEGSDTIISASSDCSLKVWDMNMMASYRTLEGHKSVVKCCSRIDSSRVVSCGDDKMVYVWDTMNGSNVAYAKHTNPVESVVNIDKYVVSGDSEGYVRIFDTRKNEDPLHCIQPHTRPIRKILKLNQICVVTGSIDGKISIISTLTATALVNMQNDAAILSLGQLTDKRTLVVGTENHIHTWNAQNGKRIHSINKGAPTHSVLGRVESGCFIAGGEEGMYGAVSLNHFKKGTTKLFKEKHNGKVNALTHMNARNFFVSGCSDGTMKVWDLNDPLKSVHQIEGHERSINALTFL
jgi:WD40 repeat protein